VKRRWLNSILLVCLGIGGTVLAAPAQKEVTLAEVLRLSANSIEVKTAARQLNIAEARLKELLAGYWPSVDPEIQYLAADRDGQPSNEETFVGVRIKLQNTWKQLAIFGEKAASEAEEALWQLAQARAEYQAAKYKAETNLAVAYLEVLRSQENLKIRENYLNRMQEEKRRLEIQLEEGTVAGLDLLRYESAVIDAQDNLFEAEKDLEEALRNLEYHAGQSFSKETVFQPVELPEETGANTRNNWETAIAGRPDVTKSQMEMKLAKNALARLKNEQRSQISAGISKTQDQAEGEISVNLTTGEVTFAGAAWDGDYDTKSEDQLITLKLSVPLFDAGAKKARVTQATENLRLKEEKHNDLLAQIRLELEDLVRTIEIHRSRYQSGLQKQENTTEILRLETIKYQEGLGNLDDVLDAEEDVVNGVANVNNLKYSYLIAQLRLREALNIQPWPWTEEVTP
jgi:outer membrane protein TolC